VTLTRVPRQQAGRQLQTEITPPINAQRAFTSNEPDVFRDEIHRQPATASSGALGVEAGEGKW
jgi:hypothetical protein